MDTRIPKPSGIKRPLSAIPKAMIPTERISAFGGKQASAYTMANRNLNMPVSRDITNLPRSVRALSPQAAKAVCLLRANMNIRRSRSACDIRNIERMQKTVNKPEFDVPRRNMRRSRSVCDIRNIQGTAFKRPEPTLAPIPAKVPRIVGDVAAHRPRPGINATVASKKPTTNLKNSKTKPMSASRPTLAAGRGKSTATVSNAKRANLVSNAEPKPVKRIPAYDYKARFQDLSEKHKVLKQKYDEKVEEMEQYDNIKEEFEQLKTNYEQAQTQIIEDTQIKESLQGQVSSQIVRIKELVATLDRTDMDLRKLTEEHKTMRREHTELAVVASELRSKNVYLNTKTNELSAENDIFKEQLFRSNMERKELHNKIMDLHGNIRVFCRVRPPVESEECKALCGWNYVDEATVEISNPDLLSKNKPGASHTFTFDSVFHPKCPQLAIFEMVSPLIQSAIDGYNVCIFAYGQTGSGKTYTMDGISSEPGVIPRTVDLLFETVKNYQRLGWEYEIRASFLEIYNEVLYDLLSNEEKEMEIRMASKYNKTDIYVSNIVEEVVICPNRLRELMLIANQNRATAATVGNDRSSRSHAVTRIQLIGRHEERSEISVGTINLVDLAGSESPKTSIRMNETKNINRSLSELTNVILAILQKHEHVPYRNSKLTHLLMPSLGGNSKTLMFINVAPFVDCFVESVKSLRFAATVNSCKLSKAKRNRILNTSNT